MSQQRITDKKILTVALLTVFLCLILFLAGTCLFFRTTPFAFLQTFINASFLPSANLCISSEIYNSGGMKWMYSLYFFIFITTLGLLFVLIRISVAWKKASYKLLSYTSITFLIMLCCIQTISRLHFLKKEHLLIYHPLSEISVLRRFCRDVKDIIPGRHQAEIQSDQDMKNDPYQLIHRTLAYFLYPNFSIRYDNATPKDCIFYFDKKDFRKDIPEDYELIYVEPTGYYAVAVKKEIAPHAD